MNRLPLPHLPKERPNSPLLRLPPELKQAIFSLLPDVLSIPAIILTCSVLSRAFLDAESLILTRILQRQIHSNIAFEAYLALNSSQLDLSFRTLKEEPWDLDKVRKLLENCDGNRSSSLDQRWRLRDALALSKLHEHVQFFTDRFASSALSIDPTGEVLSFSESQPSVTELHRIQRTFYRFEIFCNLFREREHKGRDSVSKILNPNTEAGLSPKEKQTLFFARFPPWENEQLACIRDYLFDQLFERW